MHTSNPWGGRGQRQAQNSKVILGYKASCKASLGYPRYHLENRKEKKKKKSNGQSLGEKARRGTLKNKSDSDPKENCRVMKEEWVVGEVPQEINA